MEDKFLKLTNTVYKVLEFFPESDPLKNRAKDKALSIMEHLILINETSGWASFQKEKVKVHLLEDIDILLGYIWIGKSQGWLNSANCLIIANEYEKIKKEIAPIIEPIIEPARSEITAVQEITASSQKLSNIDNTPVLQESIKIEPKNHSDSVLNITEPKTPNFSTPILSRVHDEVGISDRQKKIIEFLKKNEKAQVMDLQTILPDVTKRTIRRDLDELLEMDKIMRLGDFNQIFYKIK